jgi:hypothetical protein
MAKLISAPVDSQTADVNDSKTKIVRRVATKVFGKIENSFNDITSKYMNVEETIKRLENEVQTRQRIVSIDGKTGKVTSAKLNQFELALRRKQLAEKKTEVKLLKMKLNSTGSSLKSASSRSAEAARMQSKRINSKIRLSKQAARNIDKIKDVVNTYIQSLRTTKDGTVLSLEKLAMKDGRKFYSEAQKLLRKAPLQPEVKDMIAASAPVRTQLATMIRKSFGWTSKSK